MNNLVTMMFELESGEYTILSKIIMKPDIIKPNLYYLYKIA